MKRNMWLVVAAALLVAIPQSVLADGPDLSFGAAVSYGYDFNDPTSANGGQNTLSYSSMEQDESFNIDMVQIGLSGARGALSYAGTVSFGDLAAAAGDSADGDVALQTMNITYDFGNAAATAGRFATPIGYEVLEPWGNDHISRSRGWQAQPINHDGITASFGLDVVDVLLGVTNGFTVGDPGTNDPDDEKGIILGFGAPIGDAASANVTGIYTQDGDIVDRWLVNVILSGMFEFGEMDIDYALEGNWRNDEVDGGSETEFKNLAFYGGTAVGSGSVNVRVDFTDDEGLLTSSLPSAIQDSQVTSISVTGSLPLGSGLDARVEFRHDSSNEDIFGEDDMGDMTDTMNSLQFQVVWQPEVD